MTPAASTWCSVADLVGWVERSETHHVGRGLHSTVGFAALNPPYGCDLTEIVKLRLDEEGISIPYPQRDVHLREAKAA